MAQSSNDSFPTAMHVAVSLAFGPMSASLDRLLRALGMREEGPLALPGIEAALRLFALDAPAA